jgi:hypothetical protein
MALKIARTGQLLIGDAEFSAQQEVDVSLPTGGPWVPGQYTVAGLPIVAAIDTVQILNATLNEDYTVIIRGRAFTINSGGAPTVTTIRDALKAAIDAAAASLGVTTANVGADALSVQANIPGVGLFLSATADTPSDVTVSALDSVPSQLGVTDRSSGRFTLRNPAAITAKVGVMVAA